MILYIAAINFLIGAFDTYLTQRRITDYGVEVELNNLIRWMSTCLGPQVAAILGVMLPTTLWTYLLYYFNLPIMLALLTGFNLKRFEIQVASLFFEHRAKNIQKMIDDYNKLAGGKATLPFDSKESQPPASSSKEPYIPTDCK